MLKKVGGNMKKILSGIMTVVIIFVLSGCEDVLRWIPNFGYHPYGGERPNDYPPAKWISETPDLWFEIPLFDDSSGRPERYEGQLTIDGQGEVIYVAFGYIDQIYIVKENDDEPYTLEGHCKFSPEKLVVTVDKEKDTLLHGQYDTLTFVRYLSEETESS